MSFSTSLSGGWNRLTLCIVKMNCAVLTRGTLVVHTWSDGTRPVGVLPVLGTLRRPHVVVARRRSRTGAARPDVRDAAAPYRARAATPSGARSEHRRLGARGARRPSVRRGRADAARPAARPGRGRRGDRAVADLAVGRRGARARLGREG